MAAHFAVSPWTVRSGLSIEIKDVDGELTIPVDLLKEETPEPPTTAKPEVPTPTPGRENATSPGSLKDASAPVRDGAAPRDAAARDGAGDAGVDPDADAVEAGLTDGPVPLTDGGAIALADAGAGAAGPPDPLGAQASGVQAGPALVDLWVNMEVIRQNPVGAQMGPLLSGIPQWDTFMEGTNVDPVRDTDWVRIRGPSLLHTDKDIIFVHYSAPDAVVDKAIDVIKTHSHNGAGFDAGVPGVKATLGHADRAPRVFLRAQPRLIAVAPPDIASALARVLVKGKAPAHVFLGEAMHLTLQHPHGPISIFPERIKELRMKIVPRTDTGADVDIELENPDDAGGADTASELRGFLGRYKNSLEGSFANAMTHGLLNAIELSQDGKVVHVRAKVSREQLDAVLNAVRAQLGLPPPGTPAPSPPPH